jgi:hypothetical protein
MSEVLDLEPQMKLDTAGKRALIEQELQKNPQRSDREIARDVGCDHKTVASVRGKISPDEPTPTEFRSMLIEGTKDFDNKFPQETAEEAVDNAIAKGVVSLAPGKCPPPPGVVDEPRYDPFDPKDGDIVVPHQPAIAVYENTSGAVVIIQAASDYQGEDPIILVRPENIDALIVSLRKFLP